MSASGAAIVAVLRPVPFPKCASSNCTVVQTTYAHPGWFTHVPGYLSLTIYGVLILRKVISRIVHSSTPV